MRRAHLLFLLLAAAVPAVFQACTNREVVGVVVDEVVVQPPSATVTLGDSLQLTAVVQDDRGSILGGASPEWSSSSANIAVVDSGGMVRGMGVGTVLVSASYGSVTGTAQITVTPQPVYGFAVLETAGSTIVTEGGGSDELTLVLLTQPGENVLIDLVTADPAEVVVDSTTLVFTPTDWSTPRTVIVRGVADGFVDGDKVTELFVSVDPSSDPLYAGLPPKVVMVTSVDAEVAGFTVTQTGGVTRVDEGESSDTVMIALDARPMSDVVLSILSADPGEVVVDPTSLTFTPANWDSTRTVTVSGVDDGEIDGDQLTLVTIGVVAESSDDLWDAVPDQSIEVETVDGSLGVKVTETDGGTSVDESGTEDTFAVVLTRAPSSNVELRITVADETEVSSDTETMTFRPSDWNRPQRVRVRGVDDEWVDGPQVTAVTIEVLPGSDPAWVGHRPLQVLVTTTDDDVAGVEVTETGGETVVDEGGDTDRIRVRLTGRPLTDVVVTAVSADPGEVRVEPATLTFTPDDWDDRQDFTVVGVDDSEVDGSTFTEVTIAVDPASDPAFTGVAPQTVTVENEDDEVKVYEIVESGGATIVSESGSSDTFDVVLLYRPAWSVTIRATSLDESEATVTPSSVTISRFSDWRAPRTFTVTGVDDDIVDGDQTSLIRLEVETTFQDDRYTGAADRTLEVITLDDDGPGGAGGSAPGGN
jgi:hypothetical protein